MKTSRLSRLVTSTIEKRGENTLVNGEKIKALWAEAQPGHVSTYIGELKRGQIAYEVQFPLKVKDAPFSLCDGAELVRQSLNLTAEVRKADMPTTDNAGLFITCLAVTESG